MRAPWAAVSKACASPGVTFESLGCRVEQTEPDFAPAEIAFRILRAWSAATNYGRLLQQHPDAFKDVLKEEIERGLRLTGPDLARAEIAHSQIWRRFQAFLEKYSTSFSRPPRCRRSTSTRHTQQRSVA